MNLLKIIDSLYTLSWFILPAPRVIWCSITVLAFILHRNFYLRYIAIGYYFELLLNYVFRMPFVNMQIFGQPIPAQFVTFAPCLDTELFVSFCCFAISFEMLSDKDLSVKQTWLSIIGITKLFTISICFLLLAFSLMYNETCTIPSIITGTILGLLFGIIRSLIYDVVINDYESIIFPEIHFSKIITKFYRMKIK